MNKSEYKETLLSLYSETTELDVTELEELVEYEEIQAASAA